MQTVNARYQIFWALARPMPTKLPLPVAFSVSPTQQTGLARPPAGAVPTAAR